ncbi:hypothetical protein B0T10DRAFT_106040 [Thelonectria olida]|uniref:Uncharacterized protein n=1 Tax=Thelonectria olida TaxID=1576542 RepID=A0A9P8WF44_9HYPO|nr:hypothetical protein B0T10DRAFT_106040 [Thelonectria olida]
MRPVIITNVALAIIWLCFFRYCQKHSFHDPSTLFYDPARAYTQEYSAVREAEAQEFLTKAATIPATAAKPLLYDNKTDTSGNSEKPEGIKLCVGVPSVRRDRENFVGKTLASLADTLSVEERKRLNLKVLLGEFVSSSHPVYGQDWLPNIADEVLVYGEDGSNPIEAYHLIANSSLRWLPEDSRNKRVQLDYANLIGKCRNEGADYFVLVEDDVIASRDWFKRLTRSIEEVEARSNGHDWLYLRLFYTETYLGWNSEEWKVYLGNSLLLFTVVTGTFLFVRWRSPAMKPLKATDMIKANLDLIYLIAFWMAMYIGLYFMAGRLLVSPYRVGVHEMPQYGCCAQGLAMPYRNLDKLERGLREPGYEMAGDSFIDMVAERNGLKKWVMVPSVLQHIGIRGSSDQGYLKTTWNFSFEKGPWPLR